MEWERGALLVKFGRLTSTHSVNIPCWSWETAARKICLRTPAKRAGCGWPGDINSLMTLLTTSDAGKKSMRTWGRISASNCACVGPARRTQSKRIDICSIICISISGSVMGAGRWEGSEDGGWLEYMAARKSWIAGRTAEGGQSVIKSVPTSPPGQVPSL